MFRLLVLGVILLGALVGVAAPQQSIKEVYERAAELFAKSDYDGALVLYRNVLDQATKAGDEPEMARAMRRIATCIQRKGDLAGSLPLLDRAVALATKHVDKQTLAELMLGLTAAYAPLGRLDEAEAATRRGIELNKELGDKRRSIALQINLSVILGEKGDQEAKAEILRQAIQDAEAAGMNDLVLFAVNNLGVMYFDVGEYERSLQYMQRAVDLLEKAPTLDKARVGMIRSNLAVMLARLGRESEALAEYDRGEAIAAGDNGSVAHIRFNRGSLYKQMGNVQKGVDEYRKAADFYEDSDLRTDALRTYAGLSQGLLGLGRPQEAAAVAEKHLPEARAIGGPDLQWQLLWPLGEAYLTMGRRDEARKTFEESIAAVESIRIGGVEDEKEGFFHEKATPYHGMVRLLVEEKKPFEALQFAERAKARVLLDVLRGGRSEIVRAMSEPEKQKERALSDALARLDGQLARQGGKPSAESLAQRNAAAVELDRFRATLYQEHPELKARRGEFPALEREHVAALLRDSETAILEYTVTESGVYLFAITRDSRGGPQVEAHVLRDPSGLAAQIERFRTQLGARDLEYQGAAKALFQRVVGPAAASVRGKKRVIVVADGALWNLPFQALMTPQGRHWIEEAAVFYAPSLAALREMARSGGPSRQGARTLLAVAGPGLPEAAREAKDIGAIYGAQSSALLVGDQASKQRWKESAPNYRVLHVATHGILNGNNPLYSYLTLNHGGLTAREILGMNLEADIAVLSACETARGRFRFGEGMIGMSWAFLVAGAPTTVVSQWKVDAAATSRLMVAFHRRLKASRGARAESLRSAVLETLGSGQYRHPFYWAGFVMVGNGY